MTAGRVRGLPAARATSAPLAAEAGKKPKDGHDDAKELAGRDLGWAQHARRIDVLPILDGVLFCRVLAEAGTGDGALRSAPGSSGPELCTVFLHSDGREWLACCPSGECWCDARGAPAPGLPSPFADVTIPFIIQTHPRVGDTMRPEKFCQKGIVSCGRNAR